ncbi:hypothetical protein Ga0466249_005224 [Sporomusaceae bacterium BoRhaA]|uniref:hypothetical protein n=1 Tax=Pelorhabdus rhamnosifermentans TaxID=2772457 RepID=UPI001C062B4C|nr:hypothetical protein [Pelorhabdus rhamnosifermentans]MBU2704072.1 hypothetical protein [Pelorhabdus rhamnosifermentans]
MDEVFWIYENWKNNGHRARIHREGCKHCYIPEGKEHPVASVGSAWHGPFANLDMAVDEAGKLCSKIALCKMCLRTIK